MLTDSQLYALQTEFEKAHEGHGFIDGARLPETMEDQVAIELGCEWEGNAAGIGRDGKHTLRTPCACLRPGHKVSRAQLGQGVCRTHRPSGAEPNWAHQRLFAEFVPPEVDYDQDPFSNVDLKAALRGAGTRAQQIWAEFEQYADRVFAHPHRSTLYAFLVLGAQFRLLPWAVLYSQRRPRQEHANLRRVPSGLCGS
ncbi:hypothetical protein OH76DRAFT_429170 [Lentinus brumalis]|uniref:Uncharacterized protein n=1 Tax=Lentinus brumalis TaxID=2498619 RepID=A0A371DDG5_9APHY|nr:hypothetical protein OH76DRAFT_429170 [Polyporus brumalis]